MSRMEANEKRRIVEALVLSSSEPISAAKLAEIIPYCDVGEVKDLVNELNTEYAEQDRAFEIWEVAGGFQIRTRAEFSGYLQKLQKERALRLSQAALETLAIIAYRQPVTRAEIEDVRGVDAGATVKSLLERHLIRIAGQREVPGRPMLYGTTRRFLEIFGLESLKNLPTLRELDELAREQGLLERTGTSETSDTPDTPDTSDTTESSEPGAGEGDRFEGSIGAGEVVVRHEDLPAAGSLFAGREGSESRFDNESSFDTGSEDDVDSEDELDDDSESDRAFDLEPVDRED